MTVNLLLIILQDQLRRYIDIKQSDLPSAIAAKKTREFRCPPREQVRHFLSDDICIPCELISLTTSIATGYLPMEFLNLMISDVWFLNLILVLVLTF